MKIFIPIMFLVLMSVDIYAQVPSYVPTNGLLAYYSFTGNGNDQTANANHLTNTSVTFGADRNGTANAAASFNGTSAYFLRNTPSFTFSENGSFTYSFWMKKTNTTVGISLMVGTTTAGYFISIMQSTTSFQFGTNKQQSAWTWASCNVTTNVWEHYVATYNNKVMKLYKNGVFQTTATYPYSGATTANLPLYIGKGISGSFFEGSMDDVGIWNRELSIAEIGLLFNGCDVSATLSPSVNQLNIGDTLTLIANITGAVQSLQWQLNTGSGFQNLSNGGQISGVTSDTLMVKNVNTSYNDYSYRYFVTSSTCADTSTESILKVCGAKTMDPTELHISSNQTAHFITGSTDPLATFRWQVTDANIFTDLTNTSQYQGVANDTLTISNLDFNLNNTFYRCIIQSGSCADTTAAAWLEVCGAVLISPANQIVLMPQPAKFFVKSSDPNTYYKWQENVGTGFSYLLNSAQYSGVNSDTLRLLSTALTQNGFQYRCIIGSGLCADTSSVALLTVNSGIGIDEVEWSSRIKLYPNPAQDVLYLDIDKSMSISAIELLDESGKMLQDLSFSDNVIGIDVSNLSSGVYFISIQGQGNSPMLLRWIKN